MPSFGPRDLKCPEGFACLGVDAMAMPFTLRVTFLLLTLSVCAKASLMEALRNQDLKKVEKFSGSDQELNEKDKDGRTPLIWAICYQDTAMVKAILAKEPDLNAQDKSGWSALIWAARYSNMEMIRDLVDAGAATELRDNLGETALFVVAANGNAAGANVLLRHGAQAEVIRHDGKTALQRAQDKLRSCGHAKYCHRYDKVIQVLEATTPKGWDLFKARVSTHSFQKKMGASVLASLLIGLLWGAFHQAQAQNVNLGPRKLALKTIAKRAKLRTAMRAMEVVACVLLPLGVAMLWVSATAFAPVYLVIYILPRLFEVGARCLRHPILLLASCDYGRLCSAGTPRILATAFFLFLAAQMPRDCDEEIEYGVFGYQFQQGKAFAKMTGWMVGKDGLPPMINKAASMFVCPAHNRMPSTMKWTYWSFLRLMWCISAVWLITSVMQMLRVLTLETPVNESEEGLAEELEGTLALTSAAEEVEQVVIKTPDGEVQVKAEKWLVFVPPGRDEQRL